MALNIYTRRELVPCKVIDGNDIYFTYNTQLKDDDFTKLVLDKIDKAKYVSSEIFSGRTYVPCGLNKMYLSTGAKSLLNIHGHPDLCFNMVEVGYNALALLPHVKEGIILWEQPWLDYQEDCPINEVVVDGELHYPDFNAFLDALEGG